MKLLIAAVALATAISSPALAKSSRHVHHPRVVHSQAQTPEQSYGRQSRGTPTWGTRNSDPDPVVRDYLHFDPPGNYN